MLLKELQERVSMGEVVPVDNINGKFPDEFIRDNPKHFHNLCVQNDMALADVVWVFNPVIRQQVEFNPSASRGTNV